MISEQVRTVCECADGTMLAAQPDGVSVIRGDRAAPLCGAEDGLVVTNILTLTEGFRGEPIFGSDGGGLYVLQPEGIRHIGLNDGLESEVILRVKRSRFREICWIATGNSIAYMTPDYRVTTVRHFPYSNNYDLYESADGRVWVLSGNGIYAVSAEELLRNGEIDAAFYGVPGGLPCVATSNSFSELTEDGDLYISGVKGVIRVNLAESFDGGELRASVPFVDADGKRYFPDVTGGFILPGTAKKVTIYPYVFSYSLTDPRITYRLDGFDTEDTTVSRSRLTPLDYTNLRLGAYRFLMTVRDAAGGAERTLSFRIVKGKELSAGEIGTAVLQLMSVIMMSGVLMYSSASRKRGRLDDRLFNGLILSNMVLAFGELVTYVLESFSGPLTRGALILGMTVRYAALVLFPYLLSLYIGFRARPDRERMRKTKLLYGIPCFLFIALMIVNLWTGWIFSVGAGNTLQAGAAAEVIPFAAVGLYVMLSLIGAGRIHRHVAATGLALVAGRLGLELLVRSISSTSFFYTLVLVCIQIRVMMQPTKEVAQ